MPSKKKLIALLVSLFTIVGICSAADAPKGKPVDPNDPRSVIYLGRDGKPAGTGDPQKVVSDAFKLGKGATAKALTAPGMPKDKFGLIDWMAVTDKGFINPVGALDPATVDEPPFDMNVVIQAKGSFAKDVLFQHKTHTYWLACGNCHNGLFLMGAGQNPMTMAEMSQGEWCGRCHGKVSFPLSDCNRCHSLAKKTAKKGP